MQKVGVVTVGTHKDEETGKYYYPDDEYRTTVSRAKKLRRAGLVRIPKNMKAKIMLAEDKSLSGPPENTMQVPSLENKSRGELVSLAKQAGLFEGIEGTGAQGYVKIKDLIRALRRSD